MASKAACGDRNVLSWSAAAACHDACRTTNAADKELVEHAAKKLVPMSLYKRTAPDDMPSDGQALTNT